MAPLGLPLPGIILSLIKNNDPKVRKILIDLVYSLYSLVPDCMSGFSLSFWNLLKETKTDKNKFVREASLACLKKFGDILKESPEVRETLKGAKGKAKRGGLKKKAKNKGFFKKGANADEGDKDGPRKKNKMNKYGSKELIVKGSPGLKASNSGRLNDLRSSSQGGDKLRGTIINKKMNLKNVKGRLDIKKLKKQFAQKKKGQSQEKKEEDFEVAFKEPAEKIDYEKWMNEEPPEQTTVEKPKAKRLRPRPKQAEREEEAPRDEPQLESPEEFEINIAIPAGPNPYAKKEEPIPDPFSEEEEVPEPPRMANPDSRISKKRRELQQHMLENRRAVSPRRPRGDSRKGVHQPTGGWAHPPPGPSENLRIGTGNNEFRSEFRGSKTSSWGGGNHSEEINKFKTYVKLLNKRIKEMNQEMKSLREENKFFKNRLDHMESMLFMINTTLLNGNILGNQALRTSLQNQSQAQNPSFRPKPPGKNDQNSNSSNVTSIQQSRPDPKKPQPTPAPKPPQNFEKKAQVTTVVQEEGDAPIPGDPYKNDYMSPIEQNNFGFKGESTNLAEEFMLSKEPSQLQTSWKKPPAEGAERAAKLEALISETEGRAGNAEAINNLTFELLSGTQAGDAVTEKRVWPRFLDSEPLLEQIVLLEKTLLVRLIGKLIQLEILAQVHNDMDLLALLFKWIFELICLPQFEEELFAFLDSDLFQRENRYFDDSQLDMSEICVNSTDISSIIKDTRLTLGFKVWKTTIFTISAYENEEIMEHCHKVISFMRQKSLGSERTHAMTDITEEANGKGTRH